MLKLKRIICFLLLLPCAARAANDTLTYIHSGPYVADTTEYLNLFRNFTWNVTIQGHDGKITKFVSRKPDTLFNDLKIDKVWLSSSFAVPTVLRRQVLFLNYEVEGSLSISQNGEILLSTGAFQANRKSSLSCLTQDAFRAFAFEDSLQELKLVYVPRHQTHVFDLALKIYPRLQGEKAIEHQDRNTKDSYGKGLYYLAFGIVFFILYIFFRVKTENLYFALFCLFASLAFLGDRLFPEILLNVGGLPGVISFEFLAIFFCKVLKNRERSRIPLAVISGITILCFLPIIRYNYVGVISSNIPWAMVLVYSVLYIYTSITCVYYLVAGVGQKQWEARTILLICLTPVVLLVLSFIGFAVVNSVVKQSQAIGMIFTQCLDYFTDLIVYVYPLAAVFILGKRNGLNQKQLTEQVISIKQLSEENLQKEQEKKQILEQQNDSLERQVAQRTAEVVAQKERIEKQHDELKIEKKKSDDLLRNILPEEVAEELKEKGRTEARLFDNVTVLFADFVDFTKAGESMSPQQLVNELHTCFKAFDEIIGKYNIEKIKTIGDAYLAVCGLPLPDERHAENTVRAAIEIRDFMETRRSNKAVTSFEIRVGIHSGPVVAGIVGVKKFAYDIWGDTVNTAARMEQSGTAGNINISGTTYELIKDSFVCKFRGDIAAKNKGTLKMYYVQGVETLHATSH